MHGLKQSLAGQNVTLYKVVFKIHFKHSESEGGLDCEPEWENSHFFFLFFWTLPLDKYQLQTEFKAHALD